jgi:hypothetical protein
VNSSNNYAYLIMDEVTKDAAVIDLANSAGATSVLNVQVSSRQEAHVCLRL